MKKLLIVLVAVIAIPLVAALFIKKDYAVKREIVVNRPVEEVFGYVKYLKNQDNFSKWAGMDPQMKKTFSGTDGAVGFVSAWASDSSDVGVGEQEIVRIEEGSRIDYELRFMQPFESKSPAYITTERVNEGKTKVSWGFNGNMHYPMNLMFLFMDFEEMIGDDLDLGLANLKEIMETEQLTESQE